ncbi:MAG: glucokinase [Sulfuricurvum sp.]
MRILAGDIGGTKSNFALFDRKDDILVNIYATQLASRDFATFSEMITRLREQMPLEGIDAVSLGIAGPVINQECKATNLPWSISAAELGMLLGVERIHLLNDLEATAYGMLYLSKEQWHDLNPAANPAAGHRAVIAAGTGLGEAMMFWDGSGFHPVGSEGGHSDFAPLTPQQDALLSWLRKRYADHVSYERILSGPGIAAVYDFLAETGFASEPAAITKMSDKDDKSALIYRCAVEEHDPLCIETLRLFTQIYGAEAGNLALKSMSLGGVYIGGGIAPKILSFMEEYFMETFVQKGRFSNILKNMKVMISLNPETAVEGAAHFAFDRLKG